MSHEWTPSFRRIGFRYCVWQMLWCNWAGAKFGYAVENGKPKRFWTLKGAQGFANKLNREAAHPAAGESDE